MMSARVARGVHQLNRQVEALGRRVGLPGRQNVLLAQDREFALDHQPRALVVIGDHALADDDAFAGLEFYLEGHGRLDSACATHCFR